MDYDEHEIFLPLNLTEKLPLVLHIPVPVNAVDQFCTIFIVHQSPVKTLKTIE